MGEAPLLEHSALPQFDVYLAREQIEKQLEALLQVGAQFFQVEQIGSNNIVTSEYFANVWRIFIKTILSQFSPANYAEFLTCIRSLIDRFNKNPMQENTNIIHYLNAEYVVFLEAILTKQGQLLEELRVKLTQMEKESYKLHELHKIVCDSRSQFIDGQQALLNAYRRKSIKALGKLLFRPRLGTFHHHIPKLLHVPKRYNAPTVLSSPPKISIVTPSYNQGEFLERTVISVLRQQYPNLEYIVQDGGSTDTSLDILKKYAPSFKYWESIKDKGQSNAINLGFQHATGEIMAYLNSDDLLLPGTLAYVAKYFIEHPEIDVVYGHRILIDELDQKIGCWVLPRHNDEILSWVDYIPQETLFWRRSIWDKVGGKIDENYQFAMDWELLLRFRTAKAKFARLPRFLGAFRIHQHQKSSAQISAIGTKEMQQLRLQYVGHPVSPAEINANLKYYLWQHLVCHTLYYLGVLRY